MEVRDFKYSVKYCSNCKINNKNQNLKTCSRCHNAYYCSIECQKNIG